MNNLKVNYIKQGNGDIFVFLLHGWGSSLDVYNNIIPVISDKYSVVAVDLPGMGKSEEPPFAWNVEDYAKWFESFVKGFNPEKIILFGHSFGGRIIIKLTSFTDLNIKKIVLVDSAGIKPKKSFKAKCRQRCFKIAKRLLPQKKVEELRKKMSSVDYNNATPLMKQVLVKTVNEDLTHYLSNIKAETLLFWGENDTATPISDGELMEKLIPNAGLVKVKGGHFSFLEQSFTFQRVIKSFLEIQ
ncbi:MAG: alpha/beta hydrolase [Oscillospiraceae bacterium]|nr:alpha/beta hydrolase [Oscillospiraceae bacterium]